MFCLKKHIKNIFKVQWHGKEKNMENKKVKFNVVDAIIVFVLIAAVLVVGYKLVGSSLFADNTQQYYEIQFLCEEVPDFAANVIEVGDRVTCEQTDNKLGVVSDVKVEPSRTYAVTSEGEVLMTSKPHYNCVTVTAEVEATKYEHGLMVDKSKYGVGHSITIRVGKAKIFGRVSGINKIDKLTVELEEGKDKE